jgi:hypothetical protein
MEHIPFSARKKAIFAWVWVQNRFWEYARNTKSRTNALDLP